MAKCSRDARRDNLSSDERHSGMYILRCDYPDSSCCKRHGAADREMPVLSEPRADVI